jgi:hypothetical protein
VTIEELFGEVFPIWSMPRLHKESVVRCVSSAVGSHLDQLRSCSEIGDSQQRLDAVSKEVEGSYGCV